MPETVYRAFVSCNFAPENAAVRELFVGLLKNLGFEPIVYDYQEPGRIAEKVEQHMRAADCVIAVVTRSRKLADSDAWVCSDWVHDEMTIAHAYQKPIAIFCEEEVKLDGLLALEERRQVFARDHLLKAIPDIVGFLYRLRSYLAETTSQPLLTRHFLRTHRQVLSKDLVEEKVEVLMESMVDRLEAVPHSLELEDMTPGLSVRPREFEFACLEAPFGTTVGHQVLRTSDQKHLWKVTFSPPLKKNERVRYAFRCVRQNILPWTRAELLERIKNHTYKYDRPICEACDWILTFPTSEFKFTMAFPEHYAIQDIDAEVRTGDADLLADLETRRVREGGMLTSENLFGTWSLALHVKKPLREHTYFVYYSPAN